MNVIVCVKQIPDPAQVGELDPSDNTLKREGKLILDESDSYGVEMALQLVTAAGGGEVGLVSMAPNGETSGLRTALAMGAAKAVLVSDPALAGSDALTTAKILAAASKRLGDVDLIIAGTESSDGYTGTVPEQMAEVLGLPSVTFAKHVAVDGGTLKVDRQTEAGYDEVTCSLPAVVSVTAGVVDGRRSRRRARRLGGGGSGDHRRGLGARTRGRRDRRGRRRGLRQDRRVPRQAESHLRGIHGHLQRVGVRPGRRRRPDSDDPGTADQGP
jgi:electron transfer flavoprotein beta subunit